MPKFIEDAEKVAEAEGVTRCTAPGAKLWPYCVRFPVGTLLKGEVRAMDRHQARKFLENRHPGATVRVLTKSEIAR